MCIPIKDTKVAYRILRDAQKELKSIECMGPNASDFINSSEFEKDISIKMNQDKHIFDIILFLNLKNIKSNFLQNLPFMSPTAIFKSDLKIREDTIPDQLNYSNIVDTIVQLYRKELIPDAFKDILTYSLIPSLYLMYREKRTFKHFCDFFNSLREKYNDKIIDEPLHLIFARSLFTTPSFLTFMHDSFFSPMHYIINATLDGVHLNDLRTEIFKCLKKNLKKMPSYFDFFIHRCFTKSNNEIDADGYQELLTECLFKPLKKLPCQFLAVYPWFFDFSDSHKNETAIILDSVFDDSFIKGITKLFLTNVDNYFYSFINARFYDESERYDFLKTKRIISTNDRIVLAAISLGITSIDMLPRSVLQKKKYKLYRYNFNRNEASFETVHSRYDVYSTIFELLKNGSNLPKSPPFEGPLNAEVFRHLVRHYLVVRNEYTESTQSAYLFENLKSNDSSVNFMLSSVENLKTALTWIISDNIDHCELRRNYQVRKNLSGWNNSLVISMMAQLYMALLTTNTVYTIKQPTVDEAIGDPITTFARFKEYCQECCQMVGISDKHLSEFIPLFYHRFFLNVTFGAFLNKRRDLYQYDTEVHEYLEKNAPAFISRIYETSQIDSSYFQNDFKYYTNVLRKLQRAFNDRSSEGIAKFISIHNALYEIRSILKRHHSSNGVNILIPTYLVILAHLNPPHFISNVIFLIDMVHDCTFMNYNTSSVNSILNIFLSMINEDLDTKLPQSIALIGMSLQKKLEIDMSGNDTKLIVDLYNRFADFVGLPACFPQLQTGHSISKSVQTYKCPDAIYSVKGKPLGYALFLTVRVGCRINTNQPHLHKDNTTGRIGAYAFNHEGEKTLKNFLKACTHTSLDAFLSSDCFKYKAIFTNDMNSPEITAIQSQAKVANINNPEYAFYSFLHTSIELSAY